jgi:hypothetical protein
MRSIEFASAARRNCRPRLSSSTNCQGLVPVVGLGLKTPQSRDKFTQFQALLKRNRSVLSYHSPLLSELQYMVQSIRGGTPPTIVTITDAFREALDAIWNAIAIGILIWIERTRAVYLLPDVAHRVAVQVNHLRAGEARAETEKQEDQCCRPQKSGIRFATDCRRSFPCFTPEFGNEQNPQNTRALERHTPSSPPISPKEL